MDFSEKKSTVEKYLKDHPNTTEDKIAEDTHLHIVDVLSVLYDMKSAGEVTSTPA